MTVRDAVGFIDQTLYANEDNRPEVRWTNAEVVELLGMIRGMIIVELEPPTAAERAAFVEAWRVLPVDRRAL